MDPREQKEIEELIKKALLKNQQNPARLFLLHPRFEFHILILILLNLIVGIMTHAFSIIIDVPLITFTLLSYIIFMVCVSFIEIIIKVILVKVFKGILIFTIGIINYFMQLITFVGSELLIPKFSFVNIKAIFIFTLIFIVIRYILMVIIRKYTFKLRK